jgi:type III pantothenate kinase
MLLAIDAGNIQYRFAVYEGEKMRAQWRAVTQVRAPPTVCAWLSSCWLEGLLRDIEAAIIATAVPAVLFDLRDLCRKYLKTEPPVGGRSGALDIGPKPKVDRPDTVALTGCATRWRHMTLSGRGDRGGFRHRHQFRHRLARRRL